MHPHPDDNDLVDFPCQIGAVNAYFPNEIGALVDKEELYSVDGPSMEEIKIESESDEELKAVRSALASRIWDNSQIVVPKCLRKKVLDQAHAGHALTPTMLGILRTRVWWPGMEKQVAETEASCLKCIKTGKAIKPSPRNRWQSISTYPYQCFGGVSVIVLVDLYSRFVVMKIVHSTTAEKVIEFLEEVCDKYGGYPRTLKMDNGPPFMSSCKKFQEYLKAKSITCYHSTELHPQQNGTAERYMQIVNKVAGKADNARDFRNDLKDRVRQHNRAPCRMTGVPPINLIYGRKIRDGILPLIGSAELDVSPDVILERNNEIKQRTKSLEDAKRGAKECDLDQGDKIFNSKR